MNTSNSPANIGIANQPLTNIRAAESLRPATNEHAAEYLLAETLAVTIAVILAIKLIAATSWAAAIWFLGPAALVIAALLPPIIRKDKFPEIGRSPEKIKQAIRILIPTCLVIFPATFAALWLLNHYGVETPLRVVPPATNQIFSWLFYQFFYIAVAEEVFFRGYLQTNILRLTDQMQHTKLTQTLKNRISITLCAACFAIAHIIIHGQIEFALTFFPAIILGWLFVKTKSLIAPILFHALANTAYAIAAATLA